MTSRSPATSAETDERTSTAKPLIWLRGAVANVAGSTDQEQVRSLGGTEWIPADSPQSARIGPILKQFCSTNPGKGLLILKRGFPLQADSLAAMISASTQTDAVTAITVLSNHDPRFNPFHDLSGIASETVDQPASLVHMLASGTLLTVDDWPEHAVYLRPAAVAALAREATADSNALACLQDAQGRLLLHDGCFVHDPARELLTQSHLQNHETLQPPPWGRLSARLAEWLTKGVGLPAAFAPGSGPVSLHITHSWGGGVARWVSNLIEADEQGCHLQLRSEGPQSGQGAGQRLALYAGNEASVPLASWWIRPVIRSSLVQHPLYQQLLRSICNRYKVSRVIVSSLVGHSLDALRSGLPTVQVLHDYYPLWPLLGINPEPYLSDEPGAALHQAMEQHALMPEFGHRTAAGWQELALAWRSTLQEEGVKLAAPSQSVVSLLQKLDNGWSGLDIKVIPHGLAPFADSQAVQPRPRKDGKLRLVIPGRMQEGKGQALLLKALPELTQYAQVYLLGTGKEGEAFFGKNGVNVVLQYQREELPALLRSIGPHFAALLSVVPETFSYTLSEMRQLGIPVLANRMGSLAERIEDGKDGWLIDPTAAELIRKVSELASNVDQLDAVRAAIADRPAYTIIDMLQRYQQLCPAGLAPAEQAVAPEAQAGNGSQEGALAFQSMQLTARKRELQTRALDLQAEVDKRTDWAREREAALQKEQKNRDEWVNRLQGEIESLQESIAWLKTSLEDLQQQYQAVLSSSSWKLTKPLRAGRRVFSNLARARAWNPLRWPLLASQAVRTISTSGLRGALVRAQLSPQDLFEPNYAEDQLLEAIGDPQAPASLPVSGQPAVSIIIPVYNKWPYTAACLRSLASAQNRASFEVILVDDHSSDETRQQCEAVGGLQYLRNAKNLGFVGSCNRGLEAARGEFTVLLNNDTQVLDGWLDALLETFSLFPDTGLAGAQLRYPNGRLQEAGGIIFRDGSGWNYGRNDKIDRPEYQYLREVDYCSGACIALPTELFRQLGGFDARYAPAYYEDTDLAFRVREQGLKVRYQPAARIIHHEGITSGTDLSSGAKRYQQVNRKKFLERWQSELATYPDPIVNPGDLRQVRKSRDHRLKGRVLVIDAYTPEPDQDSGSLRLCYLLDCLQDLGYGVSFFADNRGFAGHYSEALQSRGIEVLYNPWIASLQDFFRERGPEFDFVMVSRHYVATNYLALVRKYCPQARFIFDTVDLHYLREERLAELEDSLPLKRAAAQTKRSELAVIRQSDATLVVSPTEKTVLAEAAPEARVEILSNIHRVDGCQAGFDERKDLFFVGGYQHPPNIDAASWFVNSIWPLVQQQLPGVKFHLIGSKAPERIKALHGNGVVFHGFVDKLEPWIDGCRLAVAPLRYGAGVKGKVNISMSRGQPVVATPAAVEGLHAVDGEDVLVANNAEDFASAIVRLYRDKELWEKLSSGGLRNVEQYFSLETARRNLAGLLESFQR